MNEQTDQIDREDDDFELEVVDDVPADEKPRLSEDHKADLPDDDEVEKYSESVQKRIKQLKFEYHEAERQKQEAIRLREEAIQYAQRAAAESQQLSERLSKGQSSVVESAKARYQSEIDRAKRDYKLAYEAGMPTALLRPSSASSRPRTVSPERKAGDPNLSSPSTALSSCSGRISSTSRRIRRPHSWMTGSVHGCWTTTGLARMKR